MLSDAANHFVNETIVNPVRLDEDVHDVWVIESHASGQRGHKVLPSLRNGSRRVEMRRRMARSATDRFELNEIYTGMFNLGVVGCFMLGGLVEMTRKDSLESLAITTFPHVVRR